MNRVCPPPYFCKAMRPPTMGGLLWFWALITVMMLYGCGGGSPASQALGTSVVSDATASDTNSNATPPMPPPVVDPVGPEHQAGTWNGLTTFHLVNQTGGAWTDAQVYWAIIGRDPVSGVFVYADLAGKLVPMQLSDNGPLVKGGQAYSNYFHTLAQAHAITLPAMDSARVLMSLGSPMYIKVLKDGAGNIGYAGANIENPTDPNQDVVFDFAEMAILPVGHPSQGIFVNTTRVDHFGFPLQLRVQGLNGYDQTVGEPLTETRDSLFAKFVAEVPSEFRALAQAPYSPCRIMAPSHASFQAGGVNANYLQPVIDAAWAKYRTQNLEFALDNLGSFVGRVNGDVMTFTGANGAKHYINGKPSTSMVMLGNGLLNDASGASDVGTQLQLQAQVSAAFNRGVFDSPANWHNAQNFYPAGVASNHYARFWHAHSLRQLSYGFAYDDVANQSPSLHTSSPTDVTLRIGWSVASP